MAPALNALPGVECDMPQGAFYLFVRFPAYGQDSMAIAARLLDDADIVAHTGHRLWQRL